MRDAASGAGKMPKENKKKGTGKDGLRQLAGAVEALRAEVEALKSGSRADPPAARRRAQSPATTGAGDPNVLENSVRDALREPADAAVRYVLAHRAEADAGPLVGSGNATGLARLLETSDATLARLGYAFGSAPKAALIQALLAGGPQSAARLGAQTDLSTGSLYHHLRELVHAGVIEAAGRNRYALTPRGVHAALLLLAVLAGDPPP